MIIRSKHGKNRPKIKYAKSGLWTSYRFLLRKDKVGFTLTETVIRKGALIFIQYQNHLEACYCIKGRGRVSKVLKNNTQGKKHILKPGTMYCLDKHDRHVLEAKTQLHLICVFNPALKGDEDHDVIGNYDL